ncbi:DUF1801 domain-containing protein [Flavobacteriaceae bacterium R38]|nr:DUF1801 domain-containing protein [Flavobacteriaceae bacterium R38]
MQYNVTTPTEYINALENDWRLEKLQAIRKIIKSKAPDYIEGIQYKMLGYSDDKGLVFSLNAQKDYVSFYVGDTKKVDPSGELLMGINQGKGCIRFKKSTNIHHTHIDEFIERAVDLRKQGVDIGC